MKFSYSFPIPFRPDVSIGYLGLSFKLDCPILMANLDNMWYSGFCKLHNRKMHRQVGRYATTSRGKSTKIQLQYLKFNLNHSLLLRLLTGWCISPCFPWTFLSLLFRIPFGFLKGLLYHRYFTFKNHLFEWMLRFGKDLVERSLNQKWIFDEFKRRKSHRCHEFMATILSSDSFSLTADWIRSRA